MLGCRGRESMLGHVTQASAVGLAHHGGEQTSKVGVLQLNTVVAGAHEQRQRQNVLRLLCHPPRAAPWVWMMMVALK